MIHVRCGRSPFVSVRDETVRTADSKGNVQVDKSRVLIVEDELLIAEDIRTGLESLGYNVVGISDSGRKALRDVRRLKPDVVLMDILLQGESQGIRIADTLRREFDIPVIYLTSFADQKTLDQAKITEPYGYLLKPFHTEALQSVIEMALYKHRMERALKQNQAWLSTILDSLGEAIIVTDADGVIQFINPKTEQISGRRSATLIGSRLETCFRFQDIKSGRPVEWKPADVIRHPDRYDRPRVFHLMSESGSATPVEETVTPIRDDRAELLGLVTVFRDVTRQYEYEQRLREFSAYLQTVQENERTHIAREIHDELGQTLTALKMDVSWLRRKMESIPEPVGQKLTAMTELINQIISRVKKITSELRPGLLDDLGLAAAIEWQADEFTKRTDIPCKVVIRPDNLTVGAALSTSLFRVFQEALTNIMRHAKASRVDVRLTQRNHEVELNIRDNGLGIRPDQMNDSKSFGLIGMRERIQFIGGRVRIQAKKGGGTEIRVWAPLSSETHAAKTDTGRSGG